MSDRLDRALRALREAESGESPDADETLAAVLAALRAERRVRLRRIRWALPMAAVLGLSTAALARWRPFTRSAPVEPAPVVAPSGEAPPPGGSVMHEAPDDSDSVREDSRREPLLLVPPSVPLASPPAPAPPLRAPSSPRPVPSASAAANAPPPAPSASASEDSAESDAFARVHRLHFGEGDPAATLAAWDDYLQRFPDGRFVPEARFNRAIVLLKLRRDREARAALQPFADGAYGDYRREDARRLLRTLP